MGVYYFARCDSLKEYFTPGDLDLGQKHFEVIHNDFKSVLFSLLTSGYPKHAKVMGRWCGEAVAIGDDTGGGPDTIDLDYSGYTNISSIINEWLDDHGRETIWFDDRLSTAENSEEGSSEEI